ncbi:MAG: glycosyltransferase family 39 protein, partial [Candidatus Shapirobacteria bacterium]
MIKKNNFIFRLFLIGILIAIYFFSRLQNLTAIPVFGDEAIYIRWSQIIKNVDTLRFIPQTDGKQPLFMWFIAATLKFIQDPLVGGRLVSVFAGFKIMVAIFLVTCILISFFKPEKNPIKFIFLCVKENFYFGILAATIYIFLPFSFFFDRLALPDNTLSLFGILSILFSFLLAKFRRLDFALILGLILGLAWLTKSPAIYFIVLSCLTYLVLNLKHLKTIYLPLISSLLAFVIYNILRLGPQFQMIALRNKDYIWSFSEILKHPLDPLTPHLGDTLVIFTQYISWPILLFALIGFILFLFYKKNIQYYLLMCWCFLPLIANAAVAKVFTARYILFILPSLIILISLGISVFFKRPWSKLLFLFILLIPNIIWIKNISLFPSNIQLSSTERGYLQDWTSGWGIKESADFLKTRALQKNVIVGTEGNFGTLPDGFQIYTDRVNQLTVVGLGLGFTDIPTNLTNAFNYGDEVYIL